MLVSGASPTTCDVGPPVNGGANHDTGLMPGLMANR